jgi:hypothetical protein
MNYLPLYKKAFLLLSCLFLMCSVNLNNAYGQTDIGVIFVVHGGMDTYEPQHMWDASVHQFSYDPNHSIYNFVIWNPTYWPLVLDPVFTDYAVRFIRMYEFSYDRMGGTDPFQSISDQQLLDIKAQLDANTYGLTFEVDWAGYMAADQVQHYAYPRFIYYGPDGPGEGENCTYCGEGDAEDVVLGFDTGTSEFTVGATLTGQTSGATAVIDGVTLTTGTWLGGDAAGTIALSNVSGSFEDGETVTDNGTVPGSGVADGTTMWPGCDPERYNVDGPVERLLNLGVSRIIMVDWTVGSPRFSKSFDVVEMTKRAIDDWNDAHATSIPDPIWVNDYSNLMERSYPLEPEGWTRIMKDPSVDSHVLLNGSPNPIVSDPVVTTLNVEAIEDAFSGSVDDADTGVIIFNHALHDYNEWFDPKVNDTLIINKNIKTELLNRRPTMDPDNIIGAYGGIQEVNPANGLEERNRPMRGESYGHAWIYETAKVLPGDEWGYRYWEALEYLKNRGVQHIVIGFPQVVTDNALNMVEIYNQIAGREIGYKNWLKWGAGDFTRYPGVGHPFADYWGIWVNTDCGEWDLDYTNGTSVFTVGPSTNPNILTGQTSGATGKLKWFTLGSGSWAGGDAAGTLTLKEVSGTFQSGEIITGSRDGSASANGVETQISKTECCFEMGGCGDPLRPYPPPRQTPITEKMSDLDPSLCFDMSEYGHLGYDPAMGPPDPNSPVQDQYTGTWELYIPPNDDPRVGEMFANHVLNAAVNPMVYITNGNLRGSALGESVTFEAHVVSGTGVPVNTYEWSKNKDDSGWSVVTGETSSTWTWIPGSGEEGVYDIKCSVTDTAARTGEVIWEDFAIPDPDNDGLPSSVDNCPDVQNLFQEDTFPPQGNGIGDACDCECDFNCDGNVDATDVTSFLVDFGRNQFNNPCTSGSPCDGDSNCDSNVDATDVTKFLEDFGRNQFNNPCPACVAADWCVYP